MALGRAAASLASIALLSQIPLVLGQLPTGQDTSCGTALNNTDYFPAIDAYNCLVSVPFNATVATDLLKYFRDTLKFQSTLAYLRDPPRSYQQAPVDILGGLDMVQTQVDMGLFTNQYSFDVAIQTLLYSAHDTHLTLSGGTFGVFSFGSPVDVVSVSKDGFELPKIYVAQELIDSQNGSSILPSPIETINDEPAADFLAVYSSRFSLGSVEPHGDWNRIMYSGVLASQGEYPAFTQTMFYPGDNLTFKFENGTTFGPTPWLAYVYNPPSTTLNTGQDFYNWYVTDTSSSDTGTDSSDVDDDGDDGTGDDTGDDTGDGTDASATSSAADPQSTDDGTGDDGNDVDGSSNDDGEDGDDTGSGDSGDGDDGADADSDSEDGSTSDSEDGEADITGWGGAYPETADVYQPELGLGGYITGYFLNDTKIGVLSIPSFLATGSSIADFSNTIGEFLQRAKQAGMTRILIDLQQNQGGDQLLATDTFRQFFPNVEPFSGMRTRSFDTADVIGNTLTQFFQVNGANTTNSTLMQALVDDPFVPVTELNAASGDNFTGWSEYFGPHTDNGDQFSTVFRYNLSNTYFVEDALGIVVFGFGNRSTTDQPPYQAKDIAILTDSVCGSTCDLFVEMMHHEAGVRTVVTGGLPQLGPMQARGGTRGALSFSDYEVDDRIDAVSEFNSSLAQFMNYRDNPVFYSYTMYFNLADQIRKGENFPLQFAYEAADCRIFLTPETFNNYENLWQYAASAVFFNGSTCVARSAEHNNTMQTDMWGPSDEQKLSWAKTNPSYQADNGTDGDYGTQRIADGVFDFKGQHLDGYGDDSVPLDGPCLTANDRRACDRRQGVCTEVVHCSNNKLTSDIRCKIPCVSGKCPGSSSKITCDPRRNMADPKVKKGKTKLFCETVQKVTDKKLQQCFAKASAAKQPLPTKVQHEPVLIEDRRR